MISVSVRKDQIAPGLIIIRTSAEEVTMTTVQSLKCVISVSVRKDQITPDNVEYEISKKLAL